MDPDKLTSLITDKFGCEKDKAEKIAAHAERYHKKCDSDKTAGDWISLMEKRDNQNAVAAWNWAVGFVGFPGPIDVDQFQIDQSKCESQPNGWVDDL